MGIEEALGEGFMTTRVDAVVNWARSNSLMPMPGTPLEGSNPVDIFDVVRMNKKI